MLAGYKCPNCSRAGLFDNLVCINCDKKKLALDWQKKGDSDFLCGHCETSQSGYCPDCNARIPRKFFTDVDKSPAKFSEFFIIFILAAAAYLVLKAI
jgi:hypothetical protein